MSRMTYMRSWKSLRLTSHTWLGLNPQIGRPLSRIVVPLVYLLKYIGMLFSHKQNPIKIKLQQEFQNKNKQICENKSN
jgi:hypothetical protein